MQISFDTSDLDNLDELLATARERSWKDRTAALKRIAGQVRSEATENARGFQTKSTGELVAHIEQDGTPARQWIGADVRQAFFLEYGSPTTGPPRAWLSGPARKGANQLFAEMARIGDIW